MRVLAFLCFVLISLSGQSPCFAAAAGAGTALQAQAKSTLGVGVRSLAFLFDSGLGRFALKASLVEDGSWARLVELEKAGYVTIRPMQTAEGEFVEILLTAAGEALRAEIIKAEG